MINDKMHKNGRAITDNASKALINNAGAFSEDIFKTDKILFVSSPNANEEKNSRNANDEKYPNNGNIKL